MLLDEALSFLRQLSVSVQALSLEAHRQGQVLTRVQELGKLHQAGVSEVALPPAAATSHRRFFPVRGNFGPSSIPYRSLACTPWLFDQLAPVKEGFCNRFCGFPAQWEAKLASEAA